MEWEGPAVDILGELLDQLNYKVSNRRMITLKHSQQTRGDVEYSNDIKIASDDLVTMQSHERHCIIMDLVLDQISTQQIPLSNMPYNKLINESVTLRNNAHSTYPTWWGTKK